MLIEYIIANAAIGGIATGIYFGIKKLKKPILCKTCKFLIRIGGGSWKYQCAMGDTICPIRKFDKPPEYCVSYKPRESEGEK